MAENMISPSLCLLALVIALQILTNVDGKSISNPSTNEDDEIKKSPALPAAEKKGALNTIRSNEKEDCTPFYSHKLREGFRLLRGGNGEGKSKGSRYLSPSHSPDGAGTKSSFSWKSLLLIVPFVLVIALLKLLWEFVILAKVQEFFTKKSSSGKKSDTK